jgi:hypothetical protein
VHTFPATGHPLSHPPSIRRPHNHLLQSAIPPLASHLCDVSHEAAFLCRGPPNTPQSGTGTMEPRLQRFTRPCRLRAVWQYVSCNLTRNRHLIFSDSQGHLDSPKMPSAPWVARSPLAAGSRISIFSLSLSFSFSFFFFPHPISLPLTQLP